MTKTITIRSILDKLNKVYTQADDYDKPLINDIIEDLMTLESYL